MINVSDTYKAAVTADGRRTLLRATVDMISPNFTYGSVSSSNQSSMSVAAQIHDTVPELGTPFITLERNRWLLNKTYTAKGETNDTEVGWESDSRSGSAGAVNSLYAEMSFSGVNILQSLTVYWPDNDIDGYAVDFTVDVKQSGTTYHTATITGNTSAEVEIKDFTVYNPDAIRVTVTKWSLPYRRVRIPEIWPGTHEIWDGDMLAAFSVTHQGVFTGLSLPYGTCSLTVDNSDHRFEPASKSGLFKSIEERQGIHVSIAFNDSEYVPVGTFYQHSGGWKTGNSSITMTWNLVDIIGLLVDREYLIPDDGVPTTLETWVASLVAQLGTDFVSLYVVDDAYKSLAVTAPEDRIKGQTCGQILLWLCQATLTWPRATADGKLRVGGLDCATLAAPVYEKSISEDVSNSRLFSWASDSTSGTHTVTYYDSLTVDPNDGTFTGGTSHTVTFSYTNYTAAEALLGKYVYRNQNSTWYYVYPTAEVWRGTVGSNYYVYYRGYPVSAVPIYVGNQWEPTGNDDLTLDNLSAYPVIREADDVARFDVTLRNGSKLTFPGNSVSSPNTASINNPFLTTLQQAQDLVQYILQFYGGYVVETKGRGDPSDVLGDMVTSELGHADPMTGLLQFQTFAISNGVMKDCQTKLLAVGMDGYYDESVILTDSGTFEVPEDLLLDDDSAGKLYVILVGGGDGGDCGRNPGAFSDKGANGADGDGGRVWFGTFTVQAGQSFSYAAGSGGNKGYWYDDQHFVTAGSGTASTFATLTSANGQLYPSGYLDTMNALRLARAGRQTPVPNSGDGGKGGAGASRDEDGNIPDWPEDGVAGADGCIIIYYRKAVME